MTITKKLILVLDVVSPLLLYANLMAVTVALAEILKFYDIYIHDPIIPVGIWIVFGLVFSVVSFLYFVWVNITTLRLLVNLCFPSLMFPLIWAYSAQMQIQMQIGTGIGLIFWLGLAWLGFVWVFLSNSMHYCACFWAVFSGLMIFNLGNQYEYNEPFLSNLLFGLFSSPTV